MRSIVHYQEWFVVFYAICQYTYDVRMIKTRDRFCLGEELLYVLACQFRTQYFDSSLLVS
jgi:hypothetical protein